MGYILTTLEKLRAFKTILDNSDDEMQLFSCLIMMSRLTVTLEHLSRSKITCSLKNLQQKKGRVSRTVSLVVNEWITRLKREFIIEYNERLRMKNTLSRINAEKRESNENTADRTNEESRDDNRNAADNTNRRRKNSSTENSVNRETPYNLRSRKRNLDAVVTQQTVTKKVRSSKTLQKPLPLQKALNRRYPLRSRGRDLICNNVAASASGRS